MPDMTTSLAHLAWADARLFASTLWENSEALDCRCDARRSVADLLAHIVDGAQWYRFCLIGAPLISIPAPRVFEEVAELGRMLSTLNQDIATQAALPDAEFQVSDSGKTLHVTRSMLLAQASYHSTEHRTQIDYALRSAGLTGLDLDSYDLWNFLSE